MGRFLVGAVVVAMVRTTRKTSFTIDPCLGSLLSSCLLSVYGVATFAPELVILQAVAYPTFSSAIAHVFNSMIHAGRLCYL